MVEFEKTRNVFSIEEKPKVPKSNYAVVGLYFYPNCVVTKAKYIKPSNSGELEITSVNQAYLNQNQLKMHVMSRGFAWLDTGTHEALTEATEFVRVVEKRTGLKIACLEEIALKQKWIEKEKLSQDIPDLKGEYYTYLTKLVR